MVKVSAKRPKAKCKSLSDIYQRTLDELGRREDIISRAVYESEVMRAADTSPARRITAGFLGELFDKAKEADGERLMAIRAVVVSQLCENGARALAEKISSDPNGQGLDDGFWFLAATGLLKDERWQEAEEVIPRCGGPEARSMIWQGLAKHHAGKGDLEKAKRAVDCAAGEVRDHSDTHAMALKLCRLARRCAHLGIRDKGLELMGEVDGISVDGWSMNKVTSLLVSRSRSMLALGKQGDALRLAEEALRHIEGSMVEVELEESVGHKSRGAGISERRLVRLGAVFTRLGCDGQAARCLELIRPERWRQKFYGACARACVRAGRLEKAAELVTMVRSASARLELKMEMARFYRRHDAASDAEKMMAEAGEEEKKLIATINRGMDYNPADKRLRVEKTGRNKPGTDPNENSLREPLNRLWAVKSLSKMIYWHEAGLRPRTKRKGVKRQIT